MVSELEKLKCKDVLDAGCGNGTLCSLISQVGMHVVGFDKSQGIIEVARKAYPSLSFSVVDVEQDDYPFTKASFDAVVSTEVIEHLGKPSKLVEMAQVVLKESGYLILTTPYHGYFKNLLITLFNKWDSHHTTLWEGGHVKFWSRKTLTRLLNDHDFQILRWGGVGRISYLWESMVVIAQKNNVP
jgi:2-polyprenyl-3-methyl-5-hydroxy-6-metoxy-1,4-benzoquinol methylase